MIISDSSVSDQENEESSLEQYQVASKYRIMSE